MIMYRIILDILWIIVSEVLCFFFKNKVYFFIIIQVKIKMVIVGFGYWEDFQRYGQKCLVDELR